MNIRAVVKEISKKMGPPKTRAAFGQWTAFAWAVRGLVEQGHGITDAVRHVLDNCGYANDKKAFGSLRAAFYKIRDAEWPAEFVQKGTTDEEDEGFQ